MVNKKICMVGAFAVGKTSLVKQFVECIFDDKYHTTIGVKIDKKTVHVGANSIQLMIWDIEGIDGFTDLKPSYLRGASGIILVVDGTRKKTLESAQEIRKIVDEHLGDIPTILLINKSDLKGAWQFDQQDTEFLGVDEDNIYQTSAKKDQNVELAFKKLVELVLS
ncbi:MAG: GTP-binding protein [Kangiellaceae bacterium]|nr:GTP-binding protein [Kangiellaceae bacterium]